MIGDFGWKRCVPGHKLREQRGWKSVVAFFNKPVSNQTDCHNNKEKNNGTRSKVDDTFPSLLCEVANRSDRGLLKELSFDRKEN